MFSTLSPKHRISTLAFFFSSVFIVVTLIFLLCYFFEPRWDTNDDVGMSMFAHGYGIAKFGSPNILFSNILWGYLVRLIPQVNGILGYSIATLSVLTIVGIVVLFGLFLLEVGYVACFLALILVLVPSVLFPQFTINAGLLMVGAIICGQLYTRNKNCITLVIGCFLAFFSYLVRSQEFWFVIIIALPWLPWRALQLHRSAKIALCILTAAIAISSVINQYAYQGKEWQAYNLLNPARVPFTDYGAGKYLKQHPDILSQHGYSINDISLIESWFFADSKIAQSQKLNAMLTELGALPAQDGSLTNAWLGVLTLWHPRILTMVLAALCLALLRPNWKIAASWGLCIAAAFTIGLLGRPGVLRIFVPLVCLLLIVPLFSWPSSDKRNYLSIGLLFFAALFNSAHLFSESKAYQNISQQIRYSFINFPHFPVIIWGAEFPYEYIYPVLKASSTAMSYQHYGLDTSTLAPFTIATSEQKEGNDIINLLTNEKGISIMANPSSIKLLSIYCNEHFGGELQELYSTKYGGLSVNQIRCKKPKKVLSSMSN